MNTFEWTRRIISTENRNSDFLSGQLQILRALDRFINCSCDHLTSFGGSLLVKPNPIDLDKVQVQIQKLPESGNITVILAMALVFLSYVIVLVIVIEDSKNVSSEHILYYVELKRLSLLSPPGQFCVKNNFA